MTPITVRPCPFRPSASHPDARADNRPAPAISRRPPATSQPPRKPASTRACAVFRVDRGFVAQVQSVDPSSVQSELSEECRKEALKTVPGEFTPVRHVRGTLSMGRMSNPDSGGSSFSMLLGRAPHLDQQYTVFGKVLEGDSVLAALENVETRREGIFVMPKNRITITKATTHSVA